jgi:DNA polymerase type B, organellar and viral
MSVFHGSRTRSFCLKTTKSNAWPKHVACIHVRAKYEPGHSRTGGRPCHDLSKGTLLGWESYWSLRGAQQHDPTCWDRGCTSEKFWRQLIQWARISGTLWVFGWKLWPAWCLLGGVTEVAEGRLILDVRNSEQDAHLPGGRPRRSTGLFIAEDPPTIICLAVPGGGRIKMIDLANYGIEPKHYGIDGDAGALSATVKAYQDYRRLCNEFDLGGLQTTAAAQSWHAYRRSHLVHPVIVHPIEKVLSLERAAYYGGRCECLRLGRFRERLYHLDVNSMYTAIGQNVLFPTKYVAAWEPTEKLDLPFLDESKSVIADVTIRTDAPLFPACETVKEDALAPPAPNRGRNRIIYPVGTFRTALCQPELAIAVANDLIVEWHRVQYYEFAPIMSKWSTFALDMRAKLAGKGLSHLGKCCKKIINSLPGKWGQRMKIWQDFSSDVSGDGTERHNNEWFQEWGKHPSNGTITQYRTIAGQTQFMDDEQLCATSCPSIAGFWTSYGRITLSLLLGLAGLNNVFYYDTDSLIVNIDGLDRIADYGAMHATQPGKLKILADSDDVEIRGIRRYRFGKTWCVAGPFGGQIKGQGMPPEWEEHEGFGGQMWHKTVGDAVRVKHLAQFRKNYHHGVVQDNGRVWAFHVG